MLKRYLLNGPSLVDLWKCTQARGVGTTDFGSKDNRPLRAFFQVLGFRGLGFRATGV